MSMFALAVCNGGVGVVGVRDAVWHRARMAGRNDGDVSGLSVGEGSSGACHADVNARDRAVLEWTDGFAPCMGLRCCFKGAGIATGGLWWFSAVSDDA